MFVCSGPFERLLRKGENPRVCLGKRSSQRLHEPFSSRKFPIWRRHYGVAPKNGKKLVCVDTSLNVESFSTTDLAAEGKACARLLHFTDIHFHTPSISGSLPTVKEVLGYANLYLAGRRKAFDAPKAAAALIRLMKKIEPDLMIFSGDLTSTGTLSEFAMAYEHLRPLLQHSTLTKTLTQTRKVSSRPAPLIMVAGNHDRYLHKNLYGMELFFSEQMLGGGPVSPRRFDFTIQDASADVRGLANTAKPLVIITLEHCRPSRWSNGHHYIPGTLSRLESLLREHHARSIVVGHYPVLEPDGRTLYERFGRSLTDVRELSCILRRYPPLAYLCGHHHAGYIVRDVGSGFLHVNCGSSAKLGFSRALEIHIGRCEGDNGFKILGINSHMLL
ncbi:hypothetical protein CCYA_CCYA11G3117 [Cyanidiococcus yangmingshanensis]|nr:hypothetical protein CCYA_CCYA11G3117 [Cyanidiococcus yangmingshanensis]